MIIIQEQKSKLEEKLCEGWSLPTELFGDMGADIYNFEVDNYTFFLDNVKSLNQLVEGLQNLSPLADDALSIAKKMKEQDFLIFKKVLQYERKMEDSRLPNKYLSLVIPQKFILANSLAEEYKVPLGAALIRVIELEINGGVLK